MRPNLLYDLREYVVLEALNGWYKEALEFLEIKVSRIIYGFDE